MARWSATASSAPCASPSGSRPTPLPETHDFVIVARPEAAKLTAEQGEPGLREALRELLDEAGLTGETKP